LTEFPPAGEKPHNKHNSKDNGGCFDDEHFLIFLPDSAVAPYPQTGRRVAPLILSSTLSTGVDTINGGVPKQGASPLLLWVQASLFAVFLIESTH